MAHQSRALVQEDLSLAFSTKVWQLQGDPTSLVSEDMCSCAHTHTQIHN